MCSYFVRLPCLSAEAAAHIASTTIAATATNTFLTDLTAADVSYVTAAAPLITSATQAFNNAVDAAYVAAFPGDADQAAVSAEWTRYFNAMASAAQTAMSSEATAFQSYVNGLAGDMHTTMNNIASEATQLATDYGNALTTYVSVLGAAATLEVSQYAAAGVVWVDSVATDVKNAIQNAANAWLQMADDGVDAAKILADDYSNFRNGFVHSYLGAFVPHQTNVINEDRQAAKDMDSELTTLASGVAAEQYDLALDDLSESKSAALALSPLDDVVINAWAALESAWSIISAWDYHTDTLAAPVSRFAYTYPGGTGPVSGINHAFDLASNDDEVVMAAAVAATSYPHWFWDDYLSRVFSWEPPQPAVDGWDVAMRRTRKTAVVTAGVAGVAAGGAAAAGVGSMTMTEIGAATASLAVTTTAEVYVIGTLTASNVAALVASSGGRVVTVFTRLFNSPASNRMLHAAQNVNLANAVGPGRQLFTGRIPLDLYNRLLLDGHIQHVTTEMNGVVGMEVRFSAQAMSILQQYFQ